MSILTPAQRQALSKIVDVKTDVANRRRHFRCPYGVRGSLRIHFGAHEERVPVWVVDFSADGAGLVSAQEIPVDSGALQLTIDGQQRVLQCQVRNRATLSEFQSRRGRFHRTGICFKRKISVEECAETVCSLEETAGSR